MTDEQIMQLVQKGRTDALGHLFDRYKRALYSYFVRMTADKELSKDLTQNVFERVLRYGQSFKGGANVKSWLFQIARNVRSDHYRTQKIELDEQVELGKLEAINASEKIDYSDKMDQVERAIQQLKPTYREVLLMAWFEKMNYDDIAEALGISKGNVKVRMHRAVSNLKNLIQKKTTYEASTQ